MGFLERFFRRPEAKSASAPSVQGAPPAARVSIQTPPLVKIAGTTTHRSAEAQAMMRRHGQSSRGYLECEARLVREHVESLGRETVAVAVEGEPIGYLPLAAADQMMRSPRALDRIVKVQAFSEPDGGALRVEAWVWLGDYAPKWEWSATSRPPMTRTSRIAASHADRQRVARDSPTSQLGRVKGVHYLELIEPIKEAKRRGQLELALNMAQAGIRGAERDRGAREPAPWYTEQAAFILRKLGRVDDEVRVLRRWLSFLPDDMRAESKLGQRLEKAEALRATRGT